VIGIIYGAFTAFAQDDVKKLVAYSSVSHLGFCMLGVVAMNTMGIEGSIYTMLSHGVTTGGLFLGIGVLYERRHTRRMAEYGGIWKQMPMFAGIFLIITMGSVGLPALSGFIGEYLSLFGTFLAGDTFPVNHPSFVPAIRVLAAIATTGVIFSAIYLLYMFHKVFFGKLDKARNGGLADLQGHELATFIPLVLAIMAGGLFPRTLLKTMEPSVNHFISEFNKHVDEPDCAPHTYLAGCSAPATPVTPATPATPVTPVTPPPAVVEGGAP
jgi:NADH-quinone oxidoreductase subunit M